MRVGDIYSYRPDNHWCRHGIAVVHEDLRAWDTYWGGLTGTPGEFGGVSAEKILPENFLGNVAEFHKVHRVDYQHYADKDKIWIPTGGGSEEFYVRDGAPIDFSVSLDYLNERIREEHSKISSANYAISLLEKEIAEITAAGHSQVGK